MKKKNLNVKKKILDNLFLKNLNFPKIDKIYKEFQKNLKNNFNQKKIAVAVSGGPDSLSLAYFARCYAIKNNVKDFYYVVDHKLRNNSTIEAKKVKSRLKDLNINCKILTWKGTKPKNNIQSLAREKRYSLLSKQCKVDNVKTLLIAHHIDDLYENFFIRLSRGSGLNGLLSFYETKSDLDNNLNVIRPLINHNKEDLIFIAKKIFKFYLKDPSNNNKSFKRVRFRNLIKNLKKEGLDEKKLKLTLKNLRESNVSINHYVKQNILLNSKYFKQKSLIVLNNKFFKEPSEIVFRSLTKILKKIGENYYNARGKSVNLLLNKINQKDFYKSTLAGCIVEKVDNSVRIYKENTKKL